VNFRMVLSNSIGDLFQNGRFACARRSDDQTAGPLPQRRDHVNDARLNEVRRSLQPEFFNRVDGRQILESHRLRVILEGNLVDLIDGFELGTVAAVRWLRRALDEAALAQEIAFDCVGRNKDVRRLGVEMVLSGPQKAEAFFGDFEVARPMIVGLVLVVVPLIVVSMVVPMTVVVLGCCAHTVCVCVSRRRNRIIPENR
jgi:hypothetical protein